MELSTRPRKERTVMGTSCAACEEPLEHMLRGERVLSLTCGHVAHEACFYEYIKDFQSQECPTCGASLSVDPSRGGNIDFEKLNSLVKAQTPLVTPSHTPDMRGISPEVHSTPDYTYRNSPHAASHWDHQPPQAGVAHSVSSASFADRDSRHGGSIRYRPQPEYASDRQHNRMDSGMTAASSHAASDYTDLPHSRKHDYDVQSMEMSVSSPRSNARSPIPAPKVTVRSEFPTLTRSRQPQSLTCLVTVEVPDGKWAADPQDFKQPHTPSPGVIENFATPKIPSRSPPTEFTRESPEALQRITYDLQHKVDNWHGLEFARFGQLILHGQIRVGKDRSAWQDLDCYLFDEMLICVKERRATTTSPIIDNRNVKSTLKGSILIKKHLRAIEISSDQPILTLSLSVDDLPYFHLYFRDHKDLDNWRKALVHISQSADNEALTSRGLNVEDDSDMDAQTVDTSSIARRQSSTRSSVAPRSNITSPTDYSISGPDAVSCRPTPSIHVPVDIVVVIPVTSSMQGIKINLMRDIVRFLVTSLGDQDRMGIVTFGSSGGGMPIVGMASKAWTGWQKIYDSIRAVGTKSLRADVVEGANVAVDLLMQRKMSNPLASIMLISDAATADNESVDFVVSRAEAAKITINSFGLGLTHKPDTMIELSTRTKATYSYVKDWMMLRECVAGCLGALQSTSHQNAKLKLRLPEGSSAKFVKINGALQVIKKATGRDAEASLGDLRFGDKRDILVQLTIAADTSEPDEVSAASDPWNAIVSGLEALGGSLDSEEPRGVSVEELPLLQADLIWGDILRDGSVTQLPRPSLLAITLLPLPRKNASPSSISGSIPPHPSVVQRRMEILTSDMLTRALTLVSRNQSDRANHLLTETRSILKGLGKGGLPAVPHPHTPVSPPPTSQLPPTPIQGNGTSETNSPIPPMLEQARTQSPISTDQNVFTPAAGIDASAIKALDDEIESALEWIGHPAVFARDNRKAVLQAIGVISSQRSYTFRTPSESLWAGRIPGVLRLHEFCKLWREVYDVDSLREEA